MLAGGVDAGVAASVFPVQRPGLTLPPPASVGIDGDQWFLTGLLDDDGRTHAIVDGRDGVFPERLDVTLGDCGVGAGAER